MGGGGVEVVMDRITKKQQQKTKNDTCMFHDARVEIWINQHVST